MTSFTSGWIIWNQGGVTRPDFVPKEIYPPALQAAELTETVYSTQAEAQAAINAHGGAHRYSTAKAAGGLASGPIGSAGQAVQSTANGLASISDLFHRLTEAATWVRVAKVFVGASLLIIGLAHITGIDNKVGEVARNVPIIPV